LVNATAIGNDAPVRLLHEYVDPTNSFWLLAVSSNTLYGSTNGGATFSVLTSTYGVTATSRFQAANAFGKAYLVDGSTTTITFDGTAVAHNTDAPIGGVTAFYAGRLWIANGSTIYGSRVSDANDWTDNGIDDADAFSAVVRNNDGYTITAMKPFGPDLFIFKAHSIDRLSVDSDGLNFSLSPVTSHLGTTHPDSVVATDNSIIWLAQDGYYGYDGSTIKWISADIDPTVKGITQLDALTRSYSETDMTAGSDTNTTAERVSGQVMLVRSSTADTTASDFGFGSLLRFTTGTVSGQLHPSALGQTQVLDTFTDGNYTANPTWIDGDAALGFPPITSVVGGAVRGAGIGIFYTTSTRVTGEWSIRIGARPSLPQQLSFVAMASGPYKAGSSSYYSNFLNSYQAGFSSSFVAIFKTDSAGSRTTLASATSGPYTVSNTTITLTRDGNGVMQFIKDGVVLLTVVDTSINTSAYMGVVFNTAGSGYDEWDNVYSPSDVISSTFTSRTFDLGVPSATVTPLTITETLNGKQFTYTTQTSTDGTTWEAAQPISNGGTSTSSPARYFRYGVAFTTSSSANSWPFISDVTLGYVSVAGRYLSPAITLTGATAWLPFTAGGSAAGGGLTYALYTDTNTSINPEVAATFISSQTLTSGQTPTIATNTYAFLAATMTTTGAADPYVSEWQLQWGEGSISNIISSEFYNQKYYSAVSLGGAGNDTILIYDQNGAWTKYTGLEPYFMKKYRTNLLFGSAGAGDVVRMEEKNHFRDYDDAPISAYWTSKDFDLGAPITTKTLLRYYVTGNRVVSGNMTFGYGVERGTLTSATYALDGLTGFFRQVVKPSSLTYSEGIQHRFKVSDATLDGDMSVLSVTGQWRLNTNP